MPDGPAVPFWKRYLASLFGFMVGVLLPSAKGALSDRESFLAVWETFWEATVVTDPIFFIISFQLIIFPAFVAFLISTSFTNGSTLWFFITGLTFPLALVAAIRFVI